MKILIVCSEGRNRSRYLASYLEEKGYITDYGGAKQGALNPLTQAKIDDADIIITVHSTVKKDLLKNFTCKKKLIELDVLDDSIPAGYTWEWFNKEIVHPELKRQVSIRFTDSQENYQ